MAIQWFPGHMAKAKKQISGLMSRIDVVIEILDARLPISSSNPVLEKLRGRKPCIKVLNKKDLADPKVTSLWVTYFSHHQDTSAIPIEAVKRSDTQKILRLCRRMVPQRGVPGKTLRALVVGIPNVGKSTLINTLAGKKIARVGDRPAITTSHQQIDLRNGIHLADTPGLLWPEMSNETAAFRLAASGAVSDAAMDYVNVAHFAAEYLIDLYPKFLIKRYKMKALPESASILLEHIGKMRGCLTTGGGVDMERASAILLKDLRSGQIGRISLERPKDFESRE